MHFRRGVSPSIGRAAGVLLAGALAGCATPQLSQPEAGVAVPQTWQESDPTRASLDLATYWRLLDDPLLTEFVEAAAANNLDLAQSAARLEQARAQLRGARAGWAPQLSVNGRGSYEVIKDFPDDDQYNLGADASWDAREAISRRSADATSVSDVGGAALLLRSNAARASRPRARSRSSRVRS